MSRELIEVKLPRLKAKAFIVPYFTRAEESEIQKAKWGNMHYENDVTTGEPSLKGYNPGAMVDQDDKELVMGIKKIEYTDGKVKEGDTLKEEDVLELPSTDAKKVLLALRKAWSDPDEKKSQSKSKPSK